MKIAVIADTHGKMPEKVLQDIAGADEIWHLGDVCERTVLDPVFALGKPLSVVQGNRDVEREWPMFLKHERGGKTFFLIHIPPTTAVVGADFVLSGHTHVPRDEMVNGVRFLNPGTIGKPNHGAPPSYAWLTIEEKTGAVDWQLKLI
ncbi:MAG: metallophosphoesterase family protein [Chthoniobacterales bacterium]